MGSNPSAPRESPTEAPAPAAKPTIRNTIGCSSWKLHGCWTASQVRADQRTVECKTTARFTQMSLEQFPGTASFVASVRVVRRMGATVAFGVVGSETMGACKDHIPGDRELQPSLGCLLCDDEVLLVTEGRKVFCGVFRTTDDTTITMEVRAGILSFSLGGALLDCPELASMALSGTHRLGIGLTHQGQVVELVAGTGVPACAVEAIPQSTSGGAGEMAALMALLALAGGSTSGHGFRDNMRSIDCNGSDEVAVCVRSFIATLHMKDAVEATSAKFEVRVLRTQSKPVVVGVLGEDTTNHAHAPIGSRELAQSTGLMSNGDVVFGGAVLCFFMPFSDGDVVGAELRGGALYVTVNGNGMTVPTVRFQQRVRFGVTLTEQGQAVKLGRDAVTPDERRYLAEKGVSLPAP